ncbi:MAG: DUF2167 domain-containing protein [Flavobacteriales bacterium]|jgi:uncharacterized membrane-anchored protein|nr:DUF2167 domain-containing protein [Flavobacteriales bacterium]
MNNNIFIFFLSLLLLNNSSFAESPSDSTLLESELEELLYLQHYYDSIEATLNYEHGEILLKNGIAKIVVPQGFKYLNGKDSEMILTDIWGNPPSDFQDRSLGLLFPQNASPFIDSSYAINITYTEDGYVDDEDAKNIDYDELLTTMQEDCENANPYRKERGYEAIYLIGWASPPFYDEKNKKLHWAKELQFGDYEEHTLNYNIRILGRKGYLQLNVIGNMNVLEEVKRENDVILSSVNFTEGNQYDDFNPDYDKVAAYGIGALIAGKAIAKVGIFAKLGILLAKFWKIIAVGVVGLIAGIKKFFGKKED